MNESYFIKQDINVLQGRAFTGLRPGDSEI